jgi:glycerol-3-phosphate O-acyltransferase
VEEFHTNNRVFSSHLVAFAAFQMIKQENKKLDLYSLLRLPEEDIFLIYVEFREACQVVLDKILELEASGKLQMAPHMKQDVDAIINHGLENVGMYHAKRPLIKNRNGNIETQDLTLLFYYHNRLDGYDLEKLF